MTLGAPTDASAGVQSFLPRLPFCALSWQPTSEGSLEVKLPTRGTHGKAEVGRVTEEEARRSEKRKGQKKEEAGPRKGRKVAKHCMFPIICGSGGSKSRLATRHYTTPRYTTLNDTTLHHTSLQLQPQLQLQRHYITLHNTTLLTLYTRPDTILQQPATVQHTTVRDMRAHYTHYTTPHIQLQLHHTNHTTVQPQLHHTTTIATAALQDTTSSSCGKDGTGHSVALKDGAGLGATACSA